MRSLRAEASAESITWQGEDSDASGHLFRSSIGRRSDKFSATHSDSFSATLVEPMSVGRTALGVVW